MKTRRSCLWLTALATAQLAFWTTVGGLSGRFAAGTAFAQRPLLLVLGLMAAAFGLYLASLALVWNAGAGQPDARRVVRLVWFFALLFRLPLWWSEPIEEMDIYRCLWDGRVLAAEVNPYRYSPAQVNLARAGWIETPDLERLANILRRAPALAEIFSRIGHPGVPTIYPPLSEAVFAATAFVTPARASVLIQVRVLKGVLLLFDLGTIAWLMGLLRNLGQPAGRALAYAWCPLVLKEFANTGHMDSLAVCFTTATLWLLTRPRKTRIARSVSHQPELTISRTISPPGAAADPKTGHPLSTGVSPPSLGAGGYSPSGSLAASDWLASGLWASAVLAKLYPLVLAPVLLAYWWRRLRWQTWGVIALFGLIVFAGYALLPGDAGREKQTAPSKPVARQELAHSDLTGLGEFLRRWEMNDLLFSVLYENLNPPPAVAGAHEPWYAVVPGGWRRTGSAALGAAARAVGVDVPRRNLAFLLAQAISGGIVLTIACVLAFGRWEGDPHEQLVRRVFLCLAWLWYLSATQNPWYWTWALPLVIFAPRPWLLVSGFALVYYLRFWFLHEVPQPILPGGLTGVQFFDEEVVWGEHLPVLAMLAYLWIRTGSAGPGKSSTSLFNLGLKRACPSCTDDAAKPDPDNGCRCSIAKTKPIEG